MLIDGKSVGCTECSVDGCVLTDGSVDGETLVDGSDVGFMEGLTDGSMVLDGDSDGSTDGQVSHETGHKLRTVSDEAQ